MIHRFADILLRETVDRTQSASIVPVCAMGLRFWPIV